MIDAEFVVARLEEAGRTLLALPAHGTRPASIRSNMPTPVREAVEAYGYTSADNRAAIPDNRAISLMDEAFGWLVLIPADRMLVRRVVGMRALVLPIDGRHVHTWRGLAQILRCSHTAARLWHGHGIAMIVMGLRARELAGWSTAAPRNAPASRPGLSTRRSARASAPSPLGPASGAQPNQGFGRQSPTAGPFAD